MKLQLTRLNTEIDITPGKPICLQIEDRDLFSRVVQSLLSERGTEAIEPYTLWTDKGKQVNPKKALVMLNDLPCIPLDNKVLLGKLYAKMMASLEQEPELNLRIQELSNEVMNDLEELGVAYYGRYEFGLEWSPDTLLKAFSFAPSLDEDLSLPEKCIRYFELCADIDYLVPHVLVNSKSFLSESGLRSLYDQAFFLNIPLVLLESWRDDRVFERESKTIIDQDLWVVDISTTSQCDPFLQQEECP